MRNLFTLILRRPVAKTIMLKAVIIMIVQVMPFHIGDKPLTMVWDTRLLQMTQYAQQARESYIRSYSTQPWYYPSRYPYSKVLYSSGYYPFSILARLQVRFHCLSLPSNRTVNLISSIRSTSRWLSTKLRLGFKDGQIIQVGGRFQAQTIYDQDLNIYEQQTLYEEISIHILYFKSI